MQGTNSSAYVFILG